MTVLPDGRIVQKERAATTGEVVAAGIVLAGLWSGFRPLKHCSNEFGRFLGTPKGRITRGSEISGSLGVDESAGQLASAAEFHVVCNTPSHLPCLRLVRETHKTPFLGSQAGKLGLGLKVSHSGGCTCTPADGNVNRTS